MAKIYIRDNAFEADSERVEAYQYLSKAVDDLKSRALLFRAGISFVGAHASKIKALNAKHHKALHKLVEKYHGHNKISDSRYNEFISKRNKLRKKHSKEDLAFTKSYFKNFNSLKLVYVQRKKSGLEELELTISEILDKGKQGTLISLIEKHLGLGKK